MDRAKHVKVKPKAATQYEEMVDEKMLTHRYSNDYEDKMVIPRRYSNDYEDKMATPRRYSNDIEQNLLTHRLYSNDSPPPIPPPPVPPPPAPESLDESFVRNDDSYFAETNPETGNDVIDVDAKLYYEEALKNSEPPFTDNFVPEVKIVEIISPSEIVNPNIIQKESISPFEVFNKKPLRSNLETKPKPSASFTSLTSQKEEVKDVSKSEEKIPDGIVKNAKSSLQKDSEKVSVKKPVEIEEELKEIVDARKVKKTASAYSESKEKSEQKSKTIPPSRKIAQLFKAEFR